MKFKTPTEELVHLATSDGGHTAVVDPAGTELHQRFHSLALQRGCYIDGTPRPEPASADSAKRTKETIIADGIETMLREHAEESFEEPDGRPKIDALSEVVGFAVERIERDAAWAAWKEVNKQ